MPAPFLFCTDCLPGLIRKPDWLFSLPISSICAWLLGKLASLLLIHAVECDSADPLVITRCQVFSGCSHSIEYNIPHPVPNVKHYFNPQSPINSLLYPGLFRCLLTMIFRPDPHRAPWGYYGGDRLHVRSTQQKISYNKEASFPRASSPRRERSQPRRFNYWMFLEAFQASLEALLPCTTSCQRRNYLLTVRCGCGIRRINTKNGRFLGSLPPHTKGVWFLQTH